MKRTLFVFLIVIGLLASLYPFSEIAKASTTAILLPNLKSISGWVEVGASPYLRIQDQPTNIIENPTGTSDGYWYFDDLPENTTRAYDIASVTLTLYCYVETGFAFKVGVFDSTGFYTDILTQTSTGGWITKTISVTSYYPNITGVNTASLRLYHDYTSGLGVWIDYASLTVTYTMSPITTNVISSTVDGFTAENLWTEIGISPYLNDTTLNLNETNLPTNYVKNVGNYFAQTEKAFTFANLNSSVPIDSILENITLNIKTKVLVGFAYSIYINVDGVSWVFLTNVSVTSYATWNLLTIDLSSHVTTVLEYNQMKVKFWEAGSSPNGIFIDYMYLTTAITTTVPTPVTINILDVPARIALALNIPVIVGGLMASLFILFCILVVVAMFTDSLLIITIFIVIGMCALIGLNWLPYFTLILVIVLVALMLATKFGDMISGKGSTAEK